MTVQLLRRCRRASVAAQTCRCSDDAKGAAADFISLSGSSSTSSPNFALNKAF